MAIVHVPALFPNTIIMEILIILFLIILNGIFSMSEIALVSSRKFKLEACRQERQQQCAQSAGPVQQSQYLPIHRADRHHADWYPDRYIQRRHYNGKPQTGY